MNAVMKSNKHNGCRVETEKGYFELTWIGDAHHGNDSGYEHFVWNTDSLLFRPQWKSLLSAERALTNLCVRLP